MHARFGGLWGRDGGGGQKKPTASANTCFRGGGVVGGQRKPTTAENEHECSILGVVGAVGRGDRPRRSSPPKMLHSEVVDGGQ